MAEDSLKVSCAADVLEKPGAVSLLALTMPATLTIPGHCTVLLLAFLWQASWGNAWRSSCLLELGGELVSQMTE